MLDCFRFVRLEFVFSGFLYELACLPLGGLKLGLQAGQPELVLEYAFQGLLGVLLGGLEFGLDGTEKLTRKSAHLTGGTSNRAGDFGHAPGADQ